MRRLRHIIVAAALAAATLSPAPLRAQTPPAPSAETMEAARDLFTLIFEHAMGAANARAVATAWPAIESELRSRNPALDAATLAQLRADYERIRLARLRDATTDLPAIYARLLTADEMRQLAAFYRTPPGRKMLEVIPEVMTEAFATVLPRVRPVTDETYSDFMKLLRERGLL
jgi:hypothetical protein